MTLQSIPYTIADSFTATQFSGNPAAVVILPEQHHSLSDAALLQIAAEFNLSDTAFLIRSPVIPPANSLQYSIRWFTPTVEVPLCGHATLASARVIFSAFEAQSIDTIILDSPSGELLAKKLEGGMIELDFPAASKFDVILPDSNEAAQITELVRTAIRESVMIKAIVNSHPFLLVELDASFDLENASVDASPFTPLPFTDVILTTARASTFRTSARFTSRVFGPSTGVPEDPVTGSAHCVLVPYWSQALQIPAGEIIETRQVSKRGGDMDLIWDQDKGRVRIRGTAVVTMRGELYL